MKELSDLLNMDGGAAIDWLCENANDFVLMPKRASEWPLKEMGSTFLELSVKGLDHEDCMHEAVYNNITRYSDPASCH